MNGFVAALEHHKETRLAIIHAFFGWCHLFGTIPLVILVIRPGRIRSATGVDKVCRFSPLVPPLPHIHRSRLRLYRLLLLGLPIQKAGWYARVPHCIIARH